MKFRTSRTMVIAVRIVLFVFSLILFYVLGSLVARWYFAREDLNQMEKERYARNQISWIRWAIKAYQDDHGAVPYSPFGPQRALHLLAEEGYLPYESPLGTLSYLNPRDLRMPEAVPRTLVKERSDGLIKGRIYYADTGMDIGHFVILRRRGGLLLVRPGSQVELLGPPR